MSAGRTVKDLGPGRNTIGKDGWRQHPHHRYRNVGGCSVESICLERIVEYLLLAKKRGVP
jgi:hypothetical protein